MAIKREFNYVLRGLLIAGLLAALLGVLQSGRPARAVGEASTKLSVYVPPNADYSSRDPGLLVTAVQDGTTVDIADDDADGDDDDTHVGLTLEKGQSYCAVWRPRAEPVRPSAAISTRRRTWRSWS